MNVFPHANHHGLHYFTFFYAAARDRLLDRNDDDVTNGGILALRATQHLDAHDSACAGIIGYVEIGLHLDHGTPRIPFSGAYYALAFDLALGFSDSDSIAASVLARFSPAITSQRLSLEIGLCSSISTRSPTLYSLFSSWA